MNVLAFVAFLIALILLILSALASVHLHVIIILWLVVVGGLLLCTGGPTWNWHR